MRRAGNTHDHTAEEEKVSEFPPPLHVENPQEIDPMEFAKPSAGNQAIQRRLHANEGRPDGDPHRHGDSPGQEAGRAAGSISEQELAGAHPETVPSSGGKSLDGFTRSSMENRFGADFNNVRIHTGSQADESARGLDAQAYTLGNDIVFGSGQYQPFTAGGRRLLAHELAHVVQQTSGAGLGGAPESPAMEQAADWASVRARPGGGRVNVEGGAHAGIARWPRSLSSTLDPSRMSFFEIQDEIFEIRRWLVDHPANSADRQLLLGVLRQLEDELGPMAAGEVGREQFLAAFRKEFGTVLHAFGGSAAAAGQPSTITITPEGVEPPDPLWDSFTPAQRTMLMDFIITRRIPEGLFNGDEIGTTTAQQRILLSAHILAGGTYRPGSFDQRVHARMCFHWVQIVHHYAGATPAGSQGVMGGFDMFGNLMLGSGRAQTVFQEPPVYAANLPTVEVGGLGPIYPGTGQAGALATEQTRMAADPTVRPAVHRRPAFPAWRFQELQPGDWLWYYNANASPGGSHSVIFSRWSSDWQISEKGVLYREAICFSQGSPGAGGREHTARLGDQFSPGEHIHPITHVSRVSPDAQPAVTPLELLPDPGARRLAAMSLDNQRFLRTKQTQLGRPVEKTLLRLWLFNQNINSIVGLRDHLTDRQLSLLVEINASSEIETLVRLNQWLNARLANARILESNMASAFDESLEERHAEAQADIDEERAQAEQEIADIDAELVPIRTGIEVREGFLTGFDLTPEIRRLQQQLREVWVKLQNPLPGPERVSLQRQRQELRRKIQELTLQQQRQQRALSPIRAQIRELRRQSRPLQNRRRRLEARQAAEERDLPYGLLHPGSLRGQESGRTTGRLRDLDPQPPWSQLVIQPGSEPQ